jgi:hypothetical protein
MVWWVGYYVLVSASSRQKIVPDLPETPVVQIGAVYTVAGLLKNNRHRPVPARAFPDVSGKVLIIDERERCPAWRGIEVGTVEVRKALGGRFEAAV